eukprot:TRINITY_DN19103_c0_g1_i1.p1 TRINITY_DN19103_c0_g1~~TRINITY_DN19103_c0_g1_i1.p1  ORF type:complete len:178 (+),score=43.56 TRINITY_DN19103_c0_g1_i1:56-589(+)
MGAFFAKLRDLFFSKKLEVVLVGLENSGKTTFCNFLQLGPNDLHEPPTVGLNVKMLKRGGVSFKVWDIGGQQQFREEWSRYCKGCDVIVFVVDISDVERLPMARKELHRLLEDRELQNMPLLVLANKIDIGQIREQELIKGLNLDYIVDNPWVVTPISALRGDNVDAAINFLINYSK